MSNFMPNSRSPQFANYNSNAERMESTKANITTGLLVNEACISKCNFNDASQSLSSGEGDCLRQCFVKYFDALNVIRNENENFLRGIDLWRATQNFVSCTANASTLLNRMSTCVSEAHVGQPIRTLVFKDKLMENPPIFYTISHF